MIVVWLYFPLYKDKAKSDNHLRVRIGPNPKPPYLQLRMPKPALGQRKQIFPEGKEIPPEFTQNPDSSKGFWVEAHWCKGIQFGLG